MTKQEQVDALVAAGKTSKQIMGELQMTAASVRYYRESSKRAGLSRIKAKVAEHRRKLKRKSVDYSGGECLKCGYNKSLAALVFHHTDPTTKEHGFNGGKTTDWPKWKVEIDKCVMLCQNCHMELHEGQWQVDDEMVKIQWVIRAAYADKPLICYKD